MSEIRVLVADDHPLYRSGLRTTLTSLEGFEVVGEADSGEQAVARARALRPDVVVMDINMPGLTGIDATRRIVDSGAASRVLILTMYEDDDSVFAAMRAGARGYLLKGASEEEIARAVGAVAAGEAIFSAGVAVRILRYFSNVPRSGPAKPFPELTEREREVLELIAQGRSNSAIAQHLVVSPKTVRNHVSNIFNKLQVVDRAQAIVRAREAGMGQTKQAPG